MRAITLSALVALAAGCAAPIDLAFSAAARQELVDNLEASVDAQHMIAEYAYAVAHGDVDISGAQYTPPVGNQPGTLTIPDGVFPFGTGDVTVVFTAQADGNYVDPYAPGVDLSTATNLVVVATAAFSGISNTGKSMSANADFTATTVQNGLNDVQAAIDGVFGVKHDGYDFKFNANDVQMSLDLVAEKVTNVLGTVDGTVDIPGFVPADFTVNGLGDSLQIDIDAVVTSISYTLGLLQLQGG